MGGLFKVTIIRNNPLLKLLRKCMLMRLLGNVTMRNMEGRGAGDALDARCHARHDA